MSLGDYKSMQKEPGGPADAPGHVGMSVADLESENARFRELLKRCTQTLAVHMEHWDSTMRRGIGCPVCIKQRQLRDEIDTALSK